MTSLSVWRAASRDRVVALFARKYFSGLMISFGRERLSVSVRTLSLSLGFMVLSACTTTQQVPTVVAPAVVSGVDCDMEEFTRLVEKVTSDGHRTLIETPIRASSRGMPTISYSANADVNTDGSPYSYHVDDPGGSRRKAMNTVANAFNGLWEEGRNVTCSLDEEGCELRVLDIFAKARALGFDPSASTRFLATNVIAMRKGRPCIREDDPFSGYFVSPVAYAWDFGHEAGVDACDQSRYPDATALNGNVLPGGHGWASQGHLTDGFDLVVARNRDNGEIAFGFNADRGPGNKIGEVSVAMAAELKRRHITPGTMTYRETVKLAVEHVDYLIFPINDVRRANGGKPFDQAFVNAYGEETFSHWGGLARLNACYPL